MSDDLVCLTIDGVELQCPADCTVYEAAAAVGIHIPTFCHHGKLVPVGACRMCFVEIEGARGLQTSCTTPVRDGMVVRVHTSPAAVQARRTNLEFLLTNHPLDCPVCDKGGECLLQDQALSDGPGQSRYVEGKRQKDKRHPLGELIVLDQERCVLCWRCIRFLDEWAGDHELDLFGRGAQTRIDAYPGRPLSSKWQGNTIDICPVGALTSRVFRFEARVWELANTPSVCPMCAVGCNILLGIKNNQVRRVVPRENLDVNDQWICDRGRFTHGFVDHPDRLRTPLIRQGGQLMPATWDEALDLVAERFGAIIQGHGPQAVAGLGSPRVTNEANYLFQRFLRTVIGTNSIDHLGWIPRAVLPLSSLPDLENRDLIMLLGTDPSADAPLVELWIKKAVLRHGAQVLVANPRRIELSRYGGPWLGFRPGTEAALMNGLARCLLDLGVDAAQRQATRVTNLEEFRSWLEPFGPEAVAAMTGASPEALQRAASVLAQAKRPLMLFGSGWVRTAHAGANLRALSNLALLLGGAEIAFLAEDNNTLGALQMGAVPDLYPGGQPFDDNRVRSRLAGFWGGRLSPVPGLGFDDMVRAAREGSLQALWIMGADPAGEWPEAGEALGRIPFLVVQDLFMTATASRAAVVLPAASFAETDGTYLNLTGRLQRIRAAKRPPGLARPDWWIIVELARRLVEGRGRRAWAFSGPSEVLGEIAKALPGYRGLDRAALEQGGWQTPVPPPGVSRAFVRVAPSIPSPDPQYPLTLVMARLLYDRGTLMGHSDHVHKLVPASFVMIHPEDARDLGLADGDEVSVVSDTGQLPFILRVDDGIVPGVAFVPLNLSEAPVSVLVADRWTLPRVQIVR